MLRAVASEILSGTWANKPSSAANGSLYYASDVGESGTLFQYGGSRWRALNGTATLDYLGAATSAIGSAETIVMQTLFPAGAWQTNDVVRTAITMTKSGATDNGNFVVRVGTAGTTGDTSVYSIAALAATSRTGGFVFDFKLTAATGVTRIGSISFSGGGSYQGISTSAATAATTVTDASANALYVSVSIYSSGATDTVIGTGGQIQLLTP